MAPSGPSCHVDTRQTPPMWGALGHASARLFAVPAALRFPVTRFRVCEVAMTTFGLLARAGAPYADAALFSGSAVASL